MPSPGKSEDEVAAKFRVASELGLPEGWRAQVFYKGSGTARKFWAPDGTVYESVAQLKMLLGDALPPQLNMHWTGLRGRSDEENAAKLQLAAELGLPEGWRARIWNTGNGSSRKFWDPAGKVYCSLGQLKTALGELPPSLETAALTAPMASRQRRPEDAVQAPGDS
mmetsp:Transcript_124488/g.387616  ORF Transcript_124488/g.387616 Transcript_124488/m.387616 type:complete len:166 (-) Transcript_124488:150-647(-)